MAGSFQLSRQTIHDHMALLEEVFLVYDGTATIPFGEKLHAVPIRTLWETP